jgi:hypothetical protein
MCNRYRRWFACTRLTSAAAISCTICNRYRRWLVGLHALNPSNCLPSPARCATAVGWAAHARPQQVQRAAECVTAVASHAQPARVPSAGRCAAVVGACWPTHAGPRCDEGARCAAAVDARWPGHPRSSSRRRRIAAEVCWRNTCWTVSGDWNIRII